MESLEVEHDSPASSKPKRSSVLRRAAVIAFGAAMLGGLCLLFLSERKTAGREDQWRQFLKVRLFWVRHGLSCANVMDQCVLGPSDFDRIRPGLSKALQQVAGFEESSLNQTYGLHAATPEDGDCTVEVQGSSLRAGVQGADGAIFRAHDLYRDPALTSCSRLQSVKAGHAFISWLISKGISLKFIGSSFLMRAFETAHGMFNEPCRKDAALNCSASIGAALKVTPVPYMTERAPQGLTPFQEDNMPRTIAEQTQMIEDLYKHNIPVNDIYAKTWPRMAQQWQKFKAFLAMVLLPSLDTQADFPEIPDVSAFQKALEEQLPEKCRHCEDYKRTVVKWDGPQYRTGRPFPKSTYDSSDIPEVSLAVVGHSQMMTEYCLEGVGPKPNNNAVLEKLFILEQRHSKFEGLQIKLREMQGKCSLVMDAPSGKDSMGNLASPDVEICTTPFNVADFLHLAKKESLEDTACVQLASKEGAYTIQPGYAGSEIKQVKK